MKKEIKKIIPAVPEKEITETKIVCDVCGKTAKGSCYLCGRDICSKHTIYDPRDYYSDYPDRYCKICADLAFDNYYDEYEAIEKTYEQAMDEWWGKIKKESLEN